MDELTETQRQILDLERHWWKHPGAKDQTIRETFEWTATRYYQVLNRLIDLPAAAAYDALLVKRLQRIRSARQLARQAR